MNPISILKKSDCWGSFKSHLEPLSKKEKGDAFELLTKYYLQLHPTYITQLKNVWLLKEIPPKVSRKLNLPSSDEGIDLITETKQGKYWAIQCKYKEDESNSITRKELSTFTDLAFTICENIELGLVCTSVNKVSHKLRMHGDKLSYCSGEVWRGLDEKFFDRLRKFIEGETTPLKPLEPRPHQQRAIQNAYTYFIEEENNRGKLIMPCGTGKSLTGYWISQKLKSKKILVAVPSLALIRQTLEVWATESVSKNININWIAVCSDDSVAVAKRDDISVLTQDLGIKIHTNPDKITEWLKIQQNEIMVVFATYQSGESIAAASRKAKVIFDLGIMDEAHKTTGKSDSIYGHLLFDKNIKISKRIFMTATERRYQGSSDEIASMDNLSLYGDTFEFLSFKEALKLKPPIISDYKVVTIFVSRSDVAELIERNIFIKPDKGKWNDVLEAEMLSALIALRKSIKTLSLKKSVSFHSSISRAKAFQVNQDTFTKSFTDFGHLETFHVSGATPTSERANEIDEFSQSKCSLITNARCLTEGVDVPNIDCILFADPKNSVIDIVQATGRALRPYKNKTYGYVIVPVLIDEEKTDLEEHQQEAFTPLITVLRALAAEDERIVEYFHSISEGKRPDKNGIQLDITPPTGIVIDADKFIQSIELKVWSRIEHLAAWRPFEEAREFVRSLELLTKKEWWLYCKDQLPVIGNKPRFTKKKIKKPEDIPSNPHQIYKSTGWTGYKNWLGAETRIVYRSFEDARKHIHSLNFGTEHQWKRYRLGGQRPSDIPIFPEREYAKKGWKGLQDWLGYDPNIDVMQYRSFEEACEFVRKRGLKNKIEWMIFSNGKKPTNIPSNPELIYKNSGWVCYEHWLGKDDRENKEYRTFKKAREFVRKLRLKNKSEWIVYFSGGFLKKEKKPIDIPFFPEVLYKGSGWTSYPDFCGYDTKIDDRQYYSLDSPYRTFKKAREFARNLGLKNKRQWVLYCGGSIDNKEEKPIDIPFWPEVTYWDKGWMSYSDWLGVETITYRNFEEARAFVRGLNIKSREAWQRRCEPSLRNNLPKDIPSYPEISYKRNGFKNYDDWLGIKIAYLTFEKARMLVHSLNLKSKNKWRRFCNSSNKPKNIPSSPEKVYQGKGWKGYGDWLGKNK